MNPRTIKHGAQERRIPQACKEEVSIMRIMIPKCSDLRLTTLSLYLHSKHYLDEDPRLSRLIELAALSGEAQSRGVSGGFVSLACSKLAMG